jgi:DNA-binding NarL/FixJ family response regulator
MIKILIADDHPVVRQGLRDLVNAQSGWECTGEAGDGIEALHLIATLKPDLVLLDVDMPVADGVAVLRMLRRQPPTTKLLWIAATAEQNLASEVLRLGGHGLISKAATPAEWLVAMRTVAAGDCYLSPEFGTPARSLPLPAATADTPRQPLSGREQQVLRLVVSGYSSLKIAKLLSLSPKTVDTYRSRLMIKLDVSDLPALVRLAIREGVIDGD